MHTHVWRVAVYIFILAIIGLAAVALLAIWGVVPKETVWKTFASGGALALLLIALSAALRAIRHADENVVHLSTPAPHKETTMKI